MSSDNGGLAQNDPRIVRGRIDSLSLYEITDHELRILEKGSPSSVYLNFAIFLWSIGLSFLVALITTKIDSNKTFSVFAIVTTVSLMVGAFLTVLWYRLRGEVKEVSETIRERIDTHGNSRENLDESSR